MKEIKIKITFQELLSAQDAGFEHHRDYVAARFRSLGFIVTNYSELLHETWQDGDKNHYKIWAIVTGQVGKSLMKHG